MSELLEQSSTDSLSKQVISNDLSIEVHWLNACVTIKTPSKNVDLDKSITSLIESAFITLPTNLSVRNSYGLYRDEMEKLVSDNLEGLTTHSFQFNPPGFLNLTLREHIPEYGEKEMIRVFVTKAI